MTDVEIANAALALVKKPGIVNFEDGSAQSVACKALYAPSRDKALEDGIWSFAKGQYTLSPLEEEPLFSFAYAFELPGEVIAPIRVEHSPGYPVAYELFGRRIYSDSSILYVTAKTKPEDASLYTPGFSMAVAFYLAHLLAVPLAENRQLKEDYKEAYKTAIKEARAADGSFHSGPDSGAGWLKRSRE